MDATPKYQWMFEVEYIDASYWICRGHHPGLYRSLQTARNAIRAERSEHARIVRMVRATEADIMLTREDRHETIA